MREEEFLSSIKSLDNQLKEVITEDPEPMKTPSKRHYPDLESDLFCFSFS